MLRARGHAWQRWTLIAAVIGSGAASADWQVTHPFEGVTYIRRSELSPRPVTLHVVRIDLTAPGIRFKVTPPGGTRETVLQTTLDFLNQEHAQVAINGHFYVPFPALDANVNVVGLAASEGVIYSGFEPQPVAPGYIDQSYAILSYAPALNIDRSNHVSIVHRSPADSDSQHILEPVTLWNALSGSSQIVSNGVRVIPSYSGSTNGLNPGNGYSDQNPWNAQLRARTAVGVVRGGIALVLITAEQAGTSRGMTTGEIADLLINDYQVDQAINLDGGPSTTMAMEDPVTHTGHVVSGVLGSPIGIPVGSNLAVFARPPIATSLTIAVTANHHVVISWPAYAADWHLERNHRLTPDQWNPVGTASELVGDRRQIVLTPDVVGQFYRLSQSGK